MSLHMTSLHCWLQFLTAWQFQSDSRFFIQKHVPFKRPPGVSHQSSYDPASEDMQCNTTLLYSLGYSGRDYKRV